MKDVIEKVKEKNFVLKIAKIFYLIEKEKDGKKWIMNI
jgi:hypothetical protein